MFILVDLTEESSKKNDIFYVNLVNELFGDFMKHFIYVFK